MGMELNLVQLIAYTDWNETSRNSRTEAGLITTTTGCLSRCHETGGGICRWYWSGLPYVVEETSQPGNIKLTGMVQDAQRTSW